MYEAFVRPDAVHTSYVVGVVWMDTNLLTATLYSGSQIPGGGPFWHNAPISAARSTTLVGAFNAGFLMQNADGGYFTDDRTYKKLRNGAASVVIFKNGRMVVAKWGRDVLMTNQIASVRQNLDLIVDNSKEIHGLRDPKSTKWGSVVGPNLDVWRSGLGITKSGALVYVGGPGMSLSDLADVMLRAGVEEGMELDYGLDWVQFSTFAGVPGRALDGSNGASLLSSMPGEPESILLVVLGTRLLHDVAAWRRTSTNRCDDVHDDHHEAGLAVHDLSPDRPGQVAQHSEGVAQDRRTPDHPVVGLEPLHHVAGHLVGTGREGNGRLVRRHARAHDARSEQLQLDTSAVQGVSQAVAQTVETGLGAAVEIGVAPDPDRGDRGHHQDPSESLGDESPTDLGQSRDRPGEVHQRDARRGRGVVLLRELIAEQTHRDDHEIHAAADLLEGFGDDARGVADVLGVKDHGRGCARTVVLGLLGRDVE